MLRFTGFSGNNVAKFIDIQRMYIDIKVKIAWKYNYFDTHSINGHELDFCQASGSAYRFEYGLWFLPTKCS